MTESLEGLGCERGTCARCGQELLRTTNDCWHPHTVKRACPPESYKDGVMQPEWGSWGRPGREYFRAATGEHEHEWRDTGYATVEDCDCGAIRSGDFMKEPVANCPDHAVPLLDVRRVDAFITLLDWPSGVVVHACERELEITRE